MVLALLTIMLAGVLGSPSAVSSTATENYTMPDIPSKDSQPEIDPPVYIEYLGPTVQPDNAVPNYTAEMINESGQIQDRIYGSDKWYLDIDINTPGWLYIYEFLPLNPVSEGQWLAYKWNPGKNGIWQLGPFPDQKYEPLEGNHIYRILFYGNGQWAADNQYTVIQWTYQKNQSELNIVSFQADPQEIKAGGNTTLSWKVQDSSDVVISTIGKVAADDNKTILLQNTTTFVLTATGYDGKQESRNLTVTVEAPTPAAPSTNSQNPPPAAQSTEPQETPPQNILSFISNPVILFPSIATVIALVLLGLVLNKAYAIRKERTAEEGRRLPPPASTPPPDHQPSPPTAAEQQEPASPPPPPAVRAQLSLPNGTLLPLKSDSTVIGRGELSRALALNELGLISRQHLYITRDDDQYFIEDKDSANGTRLNGTEIRGKGPSTLNDGDVIELAGIVQLKFGII